MREEMYKYQITKQKLLDIASGLEENEPLPNRNALSRQCGVARVTLERAISELIGEGRLVSVDGRGTYRTASGSARASTEGAASPTLNERAWALLVYSVTKGTAPVIVRSVEDFTSRHGINLIVCNTDNDPQKEIDCLRRLYDYGVSGIIVIPSTHSGPNWEILDALRQKGVSVVACSRQVPGHDNPGVFQNFFQSGFLATEHLLHLGCRRIAYFAASRYSTIEDRLQGYLAALNLHNTQHPDDPAREGLGLSQSVPSESVEALFEEFLRAHPDTDGIYVFNDRLAVLLYAVMKRLHLRPGRDIRVVANDDSGFSASLWVPLSTVDVSADRMGLQAAEMLHRLRGGAAAEACGHTVLSGELHARESSLGADEK